MIFVDTVVVMKHKRFFLVVSFLRAITFLSLPTVKCFLLFKKQLDTKNLFLTKNTFDIWKRRVYKSREGNDASFKIPSSKFIETSFNSNIEYISNTLLHPLTIQIGTNTISSIGFCQYMKEIKYINDHLYQQVELLLKKKASDKISLEVLSVVLDLIIIEKKSVEKALQDRRLNEEEDKLVNEFNVYASKDSSNDLTSSGSTLAYLSVFPSFEDKNNVDTKNLTQSLGILDNDEIDFVAACLAHYELFFYVSRSLRSSFPEVFTIDAVEVKSNAGHSPIQYLDSFNEKNPFFVSSLFKACSKFNTQYIQRLYEKDLSSDTKPAETISESSFQAMVQSRQSIVFTLAYNLIDSIGYEIGLQGSTKALSDARKRIQTIVKREKISFASSFDENNTRNKSDNQNTNTNLEKRNLLAEKIKLYKMDKLQ